MQIKGINRNQKSENKENGSDLYHGSNGELKVSNPNLDTNPLHYAFIEAGQQVNMDKESNIINTM